MELLALSLLWPNPPAENPGNPRAQPGAKSRCYKPLSSLLAVYLSHQPKTYIHVYSYP